MSREFTKLNPAKQTLGDDLPFVTDYLRNMPDEFNFNLIKDDVLTQSYLDFLNLYYLNYEVKGITCTDFINHLRLSWIKKKSLFTLYMQSVRGIVLDSNRTVINGNSEYQNQSSFEQTDDSDYIDMAILNPDELPSSKNKSVKLNTNGLTGQNEYGSTKDKPLTTLEISKNLDNYKSEYDLLVDIFAENFAIFRFNLM